MHENREISSAPWSNDQGRSANATSRTADMHVLEKSDCAVVPVKQPNKEGRPSAEVVEGRARTVENIVQSHMLSTQSGNCMSQGMGGVRQAVLPPLIHGKSRMRRRARTDLCGGRSAMVVPTATTMLCCAEKAALEQVRVGGQVEVAYMYGPPSDCKGKVFR
jgi:hypothetical protein